MISNTTSYKLKASKSSRDLNEYIDIKNDGNISEEDQDNCSRSYSKSNNDNELPYNRTHSSVYSQRDTRFKPRASKSFEYRSNRGIPPERRSSSWRGRGSYIFRKYDESADVGGYVSNRKFQEPLNKHSSDSNKSSYHSKYYDTEKPKSDYGLNIFEDTRISKLIRRLSQESDQEKSLILCKKLLDVVLVPDNSRYIHRAFSMLVDSLYEYLCYGSGASTKRQVSRVLGRVGYVMETDFRRYFEWLFHQKYIGSSEEVKVLLIKSLKETLVLERKNSKLQDFMADIMLQTQSILEATDVPEIFMATMEIILLLEELHTSVFTNHFRDTVDILLGWHVDSNQTVRVTEFVSKSLVKLSKHWQNNVSFSLNLMSQFLEDMEPYSEQLHNRFSGRSSPLDNGPMTTDDILERITSLIRAFSTVVKCLGEKFSPLNNSNVSVIFVTDCLSKVLKTTTEALESYVPDNLAIASNECIALLLGILQTKAGSVSEILYNLMDLELSLTTDFTDSTVISMLLMISKIIKELSANLPMEIVLKLVGPKSELLRLRFSPSGDVQSAVVEVYHSLLNLKNIPLLQEAYRCVLGDLEQSYKLIVTSINLFCQNNPFEEQSSNIVEAELICLFLLRCLSLLANASSSIIGMWALRPSILELLAIDLEPYNLELSQKAPSLQYCVFYLLYSHSKCYNYFMSSSNLVTSPESKANVIDKLGLPNVMNIGDVSTSPSSGNLTIILNILCKSLKTEMSLETKIMLLQWLQEILSQSKMYLDTLCKTEAFLQIIQALIDSGHTYCAKISVAVCTNLKVLLSHPHFIWEKSFYNSVYNLCTLHINSLDEKVRISYMDLFSYLTWFTTIYNAQIVSNSRNDSDKNVYSNYHIKNKENIHMKKSVGGEMLQLQFKKFTSYLLRGVEYKNNWLQDIFICCSPLEINEINSENAEFRSSVLSSRELLYFWVVWEAALLCVNYKLRTPLGKPTETFTCIENSLKSLAKEAIGIANDNDCKKLFPIQEQVRVGLLLEFMEQLEKIIYNASAGCSEVLLAPPKPVRTFFHTNASTCREWLARIRFPVVEVALHAGQYATAIRHSQAKLKDLVTSENTQGAEFEKNIINYATALINLNEPDALRGLYVWCNKVTNRKMTWLKPAVDHTYRKFEQASEKYQHVINTVFENQIKEDSEKTSSETTSVSKDCMPLKKFVYKQIISCYKNLNSWNDVVKWKEEELKYLMNDSEKDIEDNEDLQFAKAVQAFEEGNIKSLEELSDWSNSVNKVAVGAWGTKKMLLESEVNIYKMALKVKQGDTDNLSNTLNTNLTFIRNNIQECLRNSQSRLLQEFLLLQNVTLGMKRFTDSQSDYVFNINDELKYVEDLDSLILSKIAFWFDYFENIKEQTNSTSVSSLHLQISKKARKEGNLNLAKQHIQKYLSIKKELYSIHESNGNQWSLLENVSQYVMQSGIKLDRNICTPENAKAMLEISKLLYTNDKKRSIALNVCASACAGISNQVNIAKDENLTATGSKLLMTLAKWIQKENDQQLVKEINNPLGRFLLVLPDIGFNENRQASLITAFDMASGKLLQFGVKTYPKSGKMWCTFGEWCYMWGKNAVDVSIASGSQLSETDRMAIQNNLPQEISQEDLQKVYGILSQTRDILDKDDIMSNDMNIVEKIESQLEEISFLNNLHPEYIVNLVDVWRQAQKRLYYFYELAAESFFQCLQLCTNNDTIEKGTECMSIKATLRLLRFIVKHAMELQSVLEKGLANTPTHPWKAIIPQLFSRLNHPEEYVRRRVSELLCRVATVAPHLIIFPAVVGAVEGGHKFDLNDISMPKDYLTPNTESTELGDIEDDYDDSENDESRDVLHSCFMSMVETLSKQEPETITQVQSFVSELRRISLLWDELWISTLVQHNGEIMKRLTQLESEIVKTENNISLTCDEKDQLIKEKHRIIIKPIVFILEQLHAITSREPETPHEKSFQDRYLELINEVLEKLKSPENPHKPQKSWQSLKMLQVKLQQRAHKRTSFALKMTDISPVLASMRDTVIAMPGLTSSTHKRVTILSISHQVNILPTKTKPKKLYFYGSDGQTYTYLFKGMEDLHLDERIMQFLTIANTMMAKNSDPTNGNIYRARHYSVIPLGLRSGLISWVDETTPMFSLYKRWQLREVAITNLKQSSSNAVVLRPSEIFYKKLNPLLKEHGIKNIENRKEWPLPVLKQVLIELMAETPSDLLAKELWCRSVNAGAWWQVTKNYSYSVAVMSIIGYIIGLGDRHLDNVLVDLSSGELIHIDYNVCFEKGKQLRVPEKVPFRMTPNMEVALGLTGVEVLVALNFFAHGGYQTTVGQDLNLILSQPAASRIINEIASILTNFMMPNYIKFPVSDEDVAKGIFRLACEKVLDIMQHGRETLLTLLEAFVYDPLVDWTPGAEGLAGAALRTVAPSAATKQARRDLEREVTVSMFHVRCAEMQAEWVTNREDILKQINTIIKELNKYVSEELKGKQSDDRLLELHQQMALIKEAEYHGRNHSLYTLPKRFTLYQQTQNCLQNARKGLEEKLTEFENNIMLHSTALTSLRGPQLSQWMQELNFPLDHENHRIFDIIKDFLQNAGQTSMINQCEQLESDVAQLAQQQLMYIRTCLDLLSQYGAIAGLYPSTYLEKHRSLCYVKWCKKLLDSKSVDSCHEALTEYNIIFSPETVNNPLTQQVVTFSYQLQGLLNDTNLRLQKSYDRLSIEGIPDTGSHLDKTYNDTKTSINNFLRNEKGAAKSFECVNISALCALNKRYITMEAAAASAGDYLVDLTSRDGDWFLDEMHLMSSLVTELSSLIPVQHNSSSKTEDNRIPIVLNCLKNANNVYKGLQELNFNFHTIILPETMKTIQTEEITVLTMINDVNNMILNIGYPLPEILGQLERHLRFIVMEMDSPHGNVQTIISNLRTEFENLLHSQSSSDTLTPGQMLLMGFNGLFDKLQVESYSLITTLASLETPACWKKIDQFKEAKALSAPVFNEQTRSVLDDIFLLKRVQTMSEFFSLCSQMCRAFKGIGLAAVYDDERLSKPIRRFTADYVSRQLLGVTSQTIALSLCLLLQRLGINVTNEIEQRDIGAENKVPLEDLCRKAIDSHIKRGVFTANVLAQASGLCSNLETAWRKREVARYIQQNIETQRSTMQRLQLQLTAHHWFHEDTIMLQPGLANMSQLMRSSFLLELRKACSSLLAMQSRLGDIREQLRTLISSAEQRLKWAAGANPDLNDVMAAFECAVNIRDDRLNVEQKLAVTIAGTCNTILLHEALRTRTPEALTHDTLFVNLVKNWETSCRMLVGCTEEVSPTEAGLLRTVSFDGIIDQNWIRNASTKLSDMIAESQKANSEQKKSLSESLDGLKSKISKLKIMLNTHHKLFSDVRNLLKTMAKMEDCSTELHKFLKKYRKYLEIFTTVVHKFNKEQEVSEKDASDMLNDMKLLEQQTIDIYELLLNLEGEDNGSNKNARPTLIRQDSVWMSPRKGVPVKKMKPGREQRNSYAIAVWHKVRLKLEGRDPDPGVKYSLQEQVDNIIKEATSLDNLALLYEGWTPWV